MEVFTSRGGIIPAYAGSTLFEDEFVEDKRDHPRIRGEHSAASPSTSKAAGSSPHTRGAQSTVNAMTSGGRIIPAYAGSTRTSSLMMDESADHPRIRGEHEGLRAGVLGFLGSSPHTRGAPSARNIAIGSTGIIPAYAGSTTARRASPSVSTDHPRIRGEHYYLPYRTVA